MVDSAEVLQWVGAVRRDKILLHVLQERVDLKVHIFQNSDSIFQVRNQMNEHAFKEIVNIAYLFSADILPAQNVHFLDRLQFRELSHAVAPTEKYC